MEQAAFHLSLPCYSVTKTKAYYLNVLGAIPGRSATGWADIDLFGNQITFTKGEFDFHYKTYKFEDAVLPAFHFGVLVSASQWEALRDRLQAQGVHFEVNALFLEGKTGAHRSFFVEDPNGYKVEFKHFLEPEDVFRTQ
ncbi:bleomycin resistance protein [Robiginitalea sp. M366]|uniref:VOC family protein n=1 Tax=Robiginitalea aestuariiviva TaxID=3036903 RepID=UPI00240D4203|nr:VOC family protein [Robiginitalea aestuariiviva]MDG1571237.1 bleomycin resistance protein [Robiginitalea aestuariiviva]